MVELIHEGVYYKDGQLLTGSELDAQGIQADAGRVPRRPWPIRYWKPISREQGWKICI